MDEIPPLITLEQVRGMGTPSEGLYAIRIPSSDGLERDIAELLTRRVGMATPQRPVGAVEEDRELVADEPTAAIGEDGRPTGDPRALLLALAGGGALDAPAFRSHTAADRRAALADRIRVAAGRQTGRGKEGDGEVYEKSLEIRHFPVFPYPEEAELAPSWAAPESLRVKRMMDTAPTEAVGCTINGAQEAHWKSWSRVGDLR
jgi:hypothetical protein